MAIQSSSTPYRWNSLPNSKLIRLLEIEPGPPQSQISCSIRQSVLEECSDYEALSYAWGSAEKDHVLFCGTEYIPVTATVHSAIQTLRYPDKSRTLWIDLICINQQDDDEKSQQVQMMGKIFSGADEVLIWLGEESLTDADAFGILREFEDESIALPGLSDFNNRMSGHGGDTMTLSIAALLQRQWFRRVWIVQEVALARRARMFCGSQTVKWNAMVRLARFVDDNGFAAGLGTTVSTISSIMLIAKLSASISTQSESLLSLLELLEKTQNHSSTDPRDSIFAMMGIASAASTTGVLIDYHRSCVQVYKDFIIDRLIKHKDLSCLSFSGPQPGSRITGLPTWVADWSVNAHPAPRIAYSGLGFKASGTLEAEISISQQADTVSITGYVIDVIQRVGEQNITPVMSNPYMTDVRMLNMEIANEVAAMKECDDIALVARPIYPTGETLQSVYWRLMMCNRTMTGQIPPSRYANVEHSFRYFMAHFDDYLHERWQNFDMSRIRNTKDAMYYGTTVAKWSSGRAFCATAKNYLGWVAKGVRPGDIVCILKGAEVPVVMRKEDENWTIHGDCYIHGIMGGEAVSDAGLDEQTFVIC